jgi:hypothetical protein
MTERRSSSARALEDTLVEVWHPRLLKMEYEQDAPGNKISGRPDSNLYAGVNKLVVKSLTRDKKENKTERGQTPGCKKALLQEEGQSSHSLHTSLLQFKKHTEGQIKAISLRRGRP